MEKVTPKWKEMLGAWNEKIAVKKKRKRLMMRYNFGKWEVLSGYKKKLGVVLL